MSAFQFAQIGVIRSPYKEKFAVPRQPGLVKHGGGELHLVAPYNQADAVRGLESFSHLWILFVLHHGRWRRRRTGETRRGPGHCTTKQHTKA